MFHHPSMPVSRFGLVVLATLLISGCAIDAVSQSKSGRAFQDDESSSARASVPADNPNSTRQYGLLVSFALQRQGDDAPEQFRTLWFIIDARGARIGAAVDGILLPRSTGFWLAGTAEAEVEKNQEGTSFFTTSEEYPYVVPVGQKPPKKKISVSNCSERSQVEIQFVGPDFVAYDKDYSRECGRGANDPFEQNSQVLSPIDDLTQQVKLFDYFSRDEKLSICGLFSNESIKAKCLAGKIRFGITGSDLKWTIVPKEYANFLVKAIPVSLPSKIVGYSVHFPSDAKAREAVEQAAGDGILSPDCEWVFSIRGYAYRAYHPGQALMGDDADLRPLPFGFVKVVLAQWAMGSHVQDWDRQIKALPQSEN